MYRVITIEREFGSGAAEIAASLADHLRWKLWDQALTQEIASVAHVDPSAVMCCDERRDSRFHRLAKAFWRGSYQRSMELNTAAPFDTDRFVAISQQVLNKAADTGNCVIVGRGAPYFLRERPDVFHVFLYAPRAEKIRRLRQLGKSNEEAEELVDTVDRDRMEFVKYYFNADWPTRCLYHMMINTAIGNEHVLSAILSVKETLETRLASV
jgi:cytidylate kinase